MASWREITADLVVDGAPDGVEQLLVLQTLLGAWPISPERLQGYLTKALREAKRTTSWVDVDEGFRLMTHIVDVDPDDPDSGLAIGARVKLSWIDRGEVNLPGFRLDP